MEFRKLVMMSLYARQHKRHRCQEQTVGLWEKVTVGLFLFNSVGFYFLYFKSLLVVYTFKFSYDPGG